MLNDPGCCNDQTAFPASETHPKRRTPTTAIPTWMSSGSFRRYQPVRKHNPVPQQAALLSGYNGHWGCRGFGSAITWGSKKRATSPRTRIGVLLSALCRSCAPHMAAASFVFSMTAKRTSVSSVWCPMPRTQMGDYGFIKGSPAIRCRKSELASMPQFPLQVSLPRLSRAF